MEIIGNALNGRFFGEIIKRADCDALELIRAAVAYTTQPDPLLELARRRRVPLRLYTLMDGDRFPPLRVLKEFILNTKPSIQLFITRNFFHPKIYWFEGVGAYIGSANLTNNGWNSNLECGVWVDAAEIEERGMAAELEQIFAVVASRCILAEPSHIKLAESFAGDRKDFAAARRDFEKLVAERLADLPGQDSPIDPSKTGAPMKRFAHEWESISTILLKLTEIARKRRGPAWVDASTHPAFIQDQATELWYSTHVRGKGLEEVEVLHRRNRGRIDDVIEEVFSGWEDLDDPEGWASWVNETPRQVQVQLSRANLESLTVDSLTKVVRGCHALRETTRHLTPGVLGVHGRTEVSREERFDLFAEFLVRTRAPSGKTLGEVLDYVLWGDAQTPNPAHRIWQAVHESAWKFPYIGEHTLGELIGYVRPDKYPPRNNRVRKTLRAMGFEDVHY